MTSSALHVLIDAQHAGVLERAAGSLRLVYDDDYRRSPNATPLSCSLPLAVQVHSGRTVRAFTDGLLPDSESVRTRWAREFQTRNQSFDLLHHVGEDCAGAVQFVREERLARLDPGAVEWLDDAQIGAWMDLLRVDPTGWLQDHEHGNFSLAGAQAKCALLFRDGKWGRPSGALATTHILKPASPFLPDHELNEHLSLALARAVGLASARSEVREFDGRRVVVIERYDRYPSTNGTRRVHQEDLCQAMGRPPSDKYQASGGPSASDIAHAIRTHSSDPAVDVERFLETLLFHWVIANTDAHAKNYSLLLSGAQVRLAPLYDVASTLPYADTTPTPRSLGALRSDRLNLAMSVAGTYRISEIRRRDWEQLFGHLEVDPATWVQRALALLDRVDEQLPTVVESVTTTFSSSMPGRFARSIRTAVGLRRAVLAGRPAQGRRR